MELVGAPHYETKAQVARRVSVSKRTMDNLIRRRRLPFIKLTSKLVRFPNADVDAFFAQNLRVKAREEACYELTEV
ncbi:MAG: helix-turn-helix domain-containing protein [Verrucomicrobiota bacterium]|nr:helix-turn-helix domain-containing protein [Verrucomicrobiota bacterium]